jgi:small subunit ribosomal protein S3Ae
LSKRRSKSKQAKDSFATKQLYAIAAPEDLEIGNTAPGSQIGETIAVEPEQLIGRILEVPLSSLTGNFSLIYVKLQFQITDIVGKTCKTKFKGHSYAMDYLRSLVKRRRTRVDAVDNIMTADGIQMRITTTAFTTHRAKSSIKFALRRAISKHISEKGNDLNFSDITTQILKGTLNAELYDLCRIIFPVSNVEVQKSKVVTKWVAAS